MLVGVALVNALAFSGSNYLFTILRSSGVDEERKRHDKAVEQLQAAQASWSRKRQCKNTSTRQCTNMPRSPGTTSTSWAQAPTLRLFSPEWWPKRPRNRLCHPGDGRDRPGGLQTRQVMRRVLIYSLFSVSLYNGSSRRALLRNARGRPVRPPPLNPRPSDPHHDRHRAKVA